MHNHNVRQICLSMLTCAAALGQHQHGAADPKSVAPRSSLVQPIADGSKNPASIPDDAALRVLFLTIAVPPGASGQQLASFESKIHRIGFADADRKLFLAAMNSFHVDKQKHQQNLASFYAQMKAAPAAANRATLQSIAAENGAIDQLSLKTYNTLLDQLSPDGAARLKQHLAYAKTRMKIVPPPPM